MESPKKHKRRRGGCMAFIEEYWALLVKMLLLTKRNRYQTIAEFVLAYVFLVTYLTLMAVELAIPVQITSMVVTHVLQQLSVLPAWLVSLVLLHVHVLDTT